MMPLPRLLLGCLLAASALADGGTVCDSAALLNNWPQWRGPLANGVAPHANPPIRWNETNNVRWKIPLPGRGHSSPIIFGDTVYVLAAMPVGEAQKPVYDDAPGVHDSVPVTHRHQFVALAIDRRDGSVVWMKVLREEWPHEGGHVTGSLASNSAVTDGGHIYVFFGSRGLYCLDMNGELKWSKDLGGCTPSTPTGKAVRPCSTATSSLFAGTMKPTLTSTPLTNAPGSNSGKLRAMKRLPGPRRSWSSTKASRRSSSARPSACAAMTWPPARNFGNAPA